MSIHAPTLLMAVAATLLVASVAAASMVVRQRWRRGMGWWVAANAQLVAALAMHALNEADALLVPLAIVFALQWPIVTLGGMRRFYSRGASAIPPWVDWLALGLAAMVAIGTWLAPFDGISPAQAFAVAMLGVTLHAAIAVSRIEDLATTPALKALLSCLVASAALQLVWLAMTGTVLSGSLAGTDVALGALLAPAAAALLMPQLSLVMNHQRNVAQLRASHRQLRHMVEVDPLTRLPNRGHFLELAGSAIKQAPDAAALLLFDIDRLKHINDVLGHAVGDEALRQVGTVLRETLRRRDVAGRLGGDEFAVVLPRTKVGDVTSVIARVKARLDDRQVAPRIARVSLNVGATQMLAGETLADALRRAEQALESARDAARAAIAVASGVALAAVAAEPATTVSAALPPIGLLPVGEVLA